MLAFFMLFVEAGEFVAPRYTLTPPVLPQTGSCACNRIHSCHLSSEFGWI